MKRTDTIGAKIKMLRKGKKITQEELAEKLGTTRSTISNYEIGRRTPHMKELLKISSIFNVGLDFFGIANNDEVFDLLLRAKKVFESPFISSLEKEQLYLEFMKLYIEIKGERKKDVENIRLH